MRMWRGKSHINKYLFRFLSATTHEDRHVSKYLNTIDKERKRGTKHFKRYLVNNVRQ